MRPRDTNPNPTARERLRLEREQQAKHDRIRRQLIAGGGVVTALIIAAGVTVFATTRDDAEATAEKPLVQPANTSGQEGATLVLGHAKDRLDLYEDPRCPVCAEFEQNVGPEVLKGYRDGRYRLSFNFRNFLDARFGGHGSHRALEALGADLNVSREAFLDYHAELYSKENHPSEENDRFNSTSYLLKIADKVPALKGSAKFETAVKEGTFATWANRMVENFNTSKIAGTPTLRYNGRTVAGSSGTAPMTPPDFTQALNAASEP
ncbi:thioredoxin domain-containing protein [Streptomyces sp. NPDC088197]|uniref:thioredoxin domain-containing protein n=1 Tax=Streptomyces sp. NPDC088197 TaxID=3365840 RepID=UPI003818F7B5